MDDVVSTYYNPSGQIALVVKESGNDHYSIEYYTSEGCMFHVEPFPGKSIFYVEDAAENWACGRKKI